MTRRFGWVILGAALVTAGCDPRTELSDVVPTLALSNTSLAPSGTIGGGPVTETVTIVNGTDGTLENLAAEVQYLGPVTGWLAASLDRTTATREQPATLQVRATPGSLGLGAYSASVRITAPGAGNGPMVIAVRFTVNPRPPAKLAIQTQPSGTSVNGLAFARQPVVQLLNNIDEPAAKAGVAVSVALASGGGELVGATSVLTDANGRATFTDLGITGLVGDRSLTFSAPNLTAATSATTTLLPGGPARLEAASATSQTVDAGTAVPAPPLARVVDQSGNGVSGIAIQFAASAGSTIAPAGSQATGPAGTAGPTTWTLNTVAGANTVTATVNGLQGSPLTFSATGRPGPATQLIKQSGDNLIGLVSTAVGTPHVVKVADQFGNGVAGLAVGWTVGGGGSTNPTSSVTDGNGLAQTVRTLPAAPGPVTTTAAATLASGPGTAVFTVTAANAGPAQIVKVSGDNQSATVATALTTPIRVQVLDAVGTPQPSVTVTFTTPNVGGSFPGGAAKTTDAGGFAETTWQLGTQAGAQSAQAAVGGPPPAVFAATATAGPLSLAQSSLGVSPAAITAGGSGSTITVTARDALGNPIGGLAVALANTGGGNLTQPSALTNAQGQAAGSYTSTLAGTKTVSATISGQSLPQTATITVVPGNLLAMVAQTATGFPVRFGLAASPLPSVKVQDQFGNGVPGVTVSFNITAGQSTRSPASMATNTSGIASVNSWLIGAFTGSGAQTVINQITATASGTVAGSPIVFTGTTTISFQTDLYPFFQSAPSATPNAGGCTQAGCHTAQVPIMTQTAANLYTTLLNPNQRYVKPSDSTTSSTTINLLWRKLSGLQSHTGGTRPTTVVDVIKAWVAQGAPNN